MVTYAELGAEPAWNAEFQPPSLARLCEALRTYYGVGPINIGSKGDNRHLRGYHRSFRWIKTSQHCINRTYSVVETPGNQEPGDINWLSAIDMTVPRDELIAACQRLDVAVRAGHLEKITEWYGNDDGDNQVDGYNNIRNVFASSDASHLWHLHMSFDRLKVGEDHKDLYLVLTGGTVSAEEVWDYDVDPGTGSYSASGALFTTLQRTGAIYNGQLPTVIQSLEDMKRMLVALTVGAGLSEEQVRAIVREELDKTHLGT